MLKEKLQCLQWPSFNDCSVFEGDNISFLISCDTVVSLVSSVMTLMCLLSCISSMAMPHTRCVNGNCIVDMGIDYPGVLVHFSVPSCGLLHLVGCCTGNVRLSVCVWDCCISCQWQDSPRNLHTSTAFTHRCVQFTCFSGPLLPCWPHQSNISYWWCTELVASMGNDIAKRLNINFLLS